MGLIICSVMALPAHVLDRLPSALRKNALLRSADSLALSDSTEARACWSRALLHGAFPRGGVVELCLQGGFSFGTTLALTACARVQEEGRKLTGTAQLCGFLDPGGTLHAPGAQGLGVELERLVVVRPAPAELSRVALRMAESQIFSLLVVDTLGDPREPCCDDLGQWVRVVRRLSLALEGTTATVLLLTEPTQRRSLPLPVMDRLEVQRLGLRELGVRITKSRDPRGEGAFRLAWPNKTLVKTTMKPWSESHVA